MALKAKIQKGVTDLMTSLLLLFFGRINGMYTRWFSNGLQHSQKSQGLIDWLGLSLKYNTEVAV